MKYVCIIFGLIAGLVQAQEQTVDGAQKFIAGIAEEGGLTITVFDNEAVTSLSVDDEGNMQSFSKTFPADKVSSTRAFSPCSTMFHIDLNSPTVSWINYSWKGHTEVTFLNPNIRVYREQKSEKIYHPQSKNGTRTSYALKIDWAKVPAVEKADYSKSVSMLHSDGDKVEIFVKSNDYATRLHYAMEFLRIKCDKKSATGF